MNTKDLDSLLTQRDSVEANKQSVQATRRVDRFGKPISRHFTVQGFPRLRLVRKTGFAKACVHEGEMTPRRKSKTNFREQCI